MPPPPNTFHNAEAYERFMGRWSRRIAPLLVDFAHLPSNGQVLDVGSGAGALAFAIAAHKPRLRVVGLDPSKEFSAYTAATNPFPERITFETGDAQGLHFPDATFAACLSQLVFNFIPDPAKALQELCRVTAPAGSIATATWDYAEGMQMLRIFGTPPSRSIPAQSIATRTACRSAARASCPNYGVNPVSITWKSARSKSPCASSPSRISGSPSCSDKVPPEPTSRPSPMPAAVPYAPSLSDVYHRPHSSCPPAPGPSEASRQNEILIALIPKRFRAAQRLPACHRKVESNQEKPSPGRSRHNVRKCPLLSYFRAYQHSPQRTHFRPSLDSSSSAAFGPQVPAA